MGLDEPVGEILRWQNQDLTILGVVKDMVVGSPYQSILQRIYLTLGWPGNVVSLRINPERSTHEALATIQSIFKQHVPGMPFDYYFADEQYAKKFSNEVRIGKLASVFAALAIFISCLGIVWAGLIRRRAAHKGNRYTKDSRGVSIQPVGYAVQRFCCAGAYFLCYRNSVVLLLSQRLAAPV